MVTISADAVRQFNDQGYCAPIRALTSEEAANLRDRLEIFSPPTAISPPGYATSRICFLRGLTSSSAIPACSTWWSR